MSFSVPERFRVTKGMLRSDSSFGNNGVFKIMSKGQQLTIVASDGCGWEHVSVSTPSRCPTWEEMCKVKDLFWDPSDCVLQYHPPIDSYVNNHPYCLHLWRPVGMEIPFPPEWMVGVR